MDAALQQASPTLLTSSPAPTLSPPAAAAPAATHLVQGGSSYRQREATQYRGVTRTSGTNSGLQKFDVQ